MHITEPWVLLSICPQVVSIFKTFVPTSAQMVQSTCGTKSDELGKYLGCFRLGVLFICHIVLHFSEAISCATKIWPVLRTRVLSVTSNMICLLSYCFLGKIVWKNSHRLAPCFCAFCRCFDLNHAHSRQWSYIIHGRFMSSFLGPHVSHISEVLKELDRSRHSWSWSAMIDHSIFGTGLFPRMVGNVQVVLSLNLIKSTKHSWKSFRNFIDPSSALFSFKQRNH